METTWFERVRFYVKSDVDEVVLEAYPVASTSSQKGAKRWSGKNGTFIEVENDGFTNVVLKGLEKRSSGASVYIAALTVEGMPYEVTMDEDVVMDAMLNGGVGIGGILSGTFVFVNSGTKIKIVPLDSDEYKIAKSTYDETKRVSKVLTRATLIPGHLYKGKSKGRVAYLYLGELYVTEFTKQHRKRPKKSMVFVRFYGDTFKDLKRCMEYKDNKMEVKTKISYTRDMTEENGFTLIDVAELLEKMTKSRDLYISKSVKSLNYFLENIRESAYETTVDHYPVPSTFASTLEEYDRRVANYDEYIDLLDRFNDQKRYHTKSNSVRFW